MPFVVAAAVEAIFVVSKVYATAVALGGVGAFAARLAVVTLLSSLSSKLFGPKVEGVGLSPLNVMSRSSLEHRKVVYGQAIVSGPVYYNNLSGTSNEYLWYGVALCDGRSEDLVEVWFDGETIPKADISWTAGTGASDGTGTGDVSTATYVGDNSTAGAQIFYYLGDDAQPACGALDTAFSEITSNHRLRGVTHIVVKLLYDEDTSEVWKSGPPNNIKVVLKGRLIYDPRLDTTQIIDPTTSPVTYGSSTQRTTDSTTWTYSDNPALCIADYLTQVMGVATTSIDWPSVADAADDCEVLVVIPPATSPETQEARFTCNGALSLGSSHKDNLDALLSSMAGRLSYSGGVWKVRCSVWEASSVTITEDDLAGDVEVRGSAPKSERFNGVRGFFIDPTRNYESAEFPHVSEATYVTRDNGETILYDLQLPMTNSATEAQRVAYRNLGQGNNQVIAKLKLNAKGSKIAVGDVVTHTISTLWSSKTFRCIEWARNPDGTFDVTLKEDDSTDYDDPLVTAYGTAGTGGVTVPADVVPPPTGLSATAVGTGIQLAWTNPSPDLFDYIDIYQSDSNAWGGASKIASVRADTYLVSLFAGEVRYFWVRAVRLPVLESIRSPDSDTSSVTATAPTAGGAGASSVFINQYIRSSGTPSTPGTTSASYNFDDTPPTFTPTSSWAVSVPSQTSPVTAVWVSTAQFYTADGTGTDSNTTWSAPQKLAEDGADGSPGDAGSDGAVAVFVNQFIRNASAPSTPGTTSASYNFDTTPGTFTPTSSWAAGVPAAGSPTLPIWVSTAQFYSADGTGTDSNTTWTTPQKLAEDGDPGAAGTDGIPGLPGASYLADYANADTDGSSSSAGRYHLMTSITNTTGTLSWSTWTTASGVDYFSVYKTGTSGTTDHSLFYDQTAIGDVVTIWNSDRKWVSFKITSIETPPTDMYKWGISYLSHDDADGTGNLDVDAVVHRWSRVYSEPPATDLIGDIGPITATALNSTGDVTASAVVDSDGTYDKIEEGSNTNLGTWLASGATNTDLEIMFSQIGGSKDVTGSSQDVWLVPSTDRTWTVTRASVDGDGIETAQGQIFYRNASTGMVLAVQSVRLVATREP